MEKSKPQEIQPQNSSDNIIKEEINLNLYSKLPLFYVIFFFSFLIPGIIFMIYTIMFYLPFFLQERNFFSIFSEIPSLLASLTLPIVIITCYLIHLLIVALITRWFWRISEKRSPSKSGIIPRNIHSKTLNAYHFRSFIIKYPKNAFSRGPFPWLTKWMLNFVGANKIEKGAVIEEQLAGDRFVEIGKNSYVGTSTAISSHSVDGIFGNISFAKIKIGDNFTSAGFNCLAPGVGTGNNSWLLPMTGATKYNILKGDNFYFGTPLRKLFKRKVMEYLQISEEDIKRVENLKKEILHKNEESEKLR